MENQEFKKEEVQVVELFDENGESNVFEILSEIEDEGSNYFVLTPFIEDESEVDPEIPAEVFVMQQAMKEGDEKMLEPISDTAVIEKIFAKFKENTNAKYDFTDMDVVKKEKNDSNIANTDSATDKEDDKKNQNIKVTIAVDGPWAAGKSSICLELARNLGLLYVNSDKIYQGVTTYLIHKEVDINNNDEIESQLNGLDVSFKVHEYEIFIILDNNLISTPTSDSEIRILTSKLRGLPCVKKFVTRYLREIAKLYSTIISGLNIGTFAFPKANLKFFFTASTDDRVNHWRKIRLEINGILSDFEDAKTIMKQVDKYDATVGQLKIASDAIIVDTTDIGFSQTVALMTEVIGDKLFELGIQIKNWTKHGSPLKKMEEYEQRFMNADKIELSVPIELIPPSRKFDKYFKGKQVAFIMMQFRKTPAHNKILKTIKNALAAHNIIGVRADDRQYDDDLLNNVRTYMHCCTFGISVFERLSEDEFNPNVSFEVGYMLGLKKEVCMLKDSTLKNLHTDLAGKLYREFSTQAPSTISEQITSWLKDKNLIVEKNEKT